MLLLNKKYSPRILLLCILLILSSCHSSETKNDRPASERSDYTENDLAKDTGIFLDFPEADPLDWEQTPDGVTPTGNSAGKPPENTEKPAVPQEDSYKTIAERYREDDTSGITQKVYHAMEIYSSPDSSSPQNILTDGELVEILETEDRNWMKVKFDSYPYSGYAQSGLGNTIGENLEVYAELPVEYGMARTNAGDYVPAYSRLVDIRKYFNVFSSTAELSHVADFSQYDLVVSMKLSTSETTIGEPFYDSNLCMVQYDLIPMIRKAVELFEKDGYRIVIYDAYRPTSVQQRWFDVVRVHKWVADPSIGMGGVHDRGTALDISLIDMEGNLMEMPTPMHTFTEESARNSPTMTQTARDNMNYMLGIMQECGFAYINSEWWHFQDMDTKYYLPTDHPIDSIPLVPAEATEIGTVPGN